MEWIISKSPESLICLFLDAGMSIPEIRKCPYYQNLTNTQYIVKLDEGILIDKKKLNLCLERYDTIEIWMTKKNPDYIKEQKSNIGKLCDQLIPERSDDKRSYFQLIIEISGRENFKKGLEILFSLSIKNIRALKVSSEGEEKYFILASDIKSPVALSFFFNKPYATVFYSVFSANFGIWIEWGYHYHFSDPAFHKIFYHRENESVFIKHHKKIHLSIGIRNFVPLLKFMELKYSYKSQTNIAEKKDFLAPEIECDIRLKKYGTQELRKQELDNLIQQEREIKEKIDWLRDIESIYSEEKIHKILFYPFSENIPENSANDPIFPFKFYKGHSLSQLNQLKYYHGTIGGLKKGVLVCSRQFIDGNTSAGGYEIHPRYFPRKGIVFQSNPYWMKYGNLRILTPLDFDLFPFLEVGKEFSKPMVEAFIDTAVFGIIRDSYNPGGKRVAEVDKLGEIEIKIRKNPESYIYLIFPRLDQHYMAIDEDNLEGVVIHENDFENFDIKLQNFGIHFSLNNEKMENEYKKIEKKIYNNISSQYDRSIQKIRTHLDNSFQEERIQIKKNIDEFNEFIETKNKTIANIQDEFNKAEEKIQTKQNIIQQYEHLLEKQITNFSELSKKNSKKFSKFLDKMDASLNQTTNILEKLSTQLKENSGDQIDRFINYREKIKKINRDTSQLIESRKTIIDDFNKIKEIQNKIDEEFKTIKWDCIGIDQKVQGLWNFNDACTELNEHFSEVERYIKSIKEVSNMSNVVANPIESDELGQWLKEINERISRLLSYINSIGEEKNIDSRQLLFQIKTPVERKLREIDAILRKLQEIALESKVKKEIFNHTISQINNLKWQIHK